MQKQPDINVNTGEKPRDVLKYPIMIVFFVFLAVFTLVDMLKPAKAVSELENRPLKQAPVFNWEMLVENKWTLEYGEYTRDQFLLRDGWMSLYSGFEVAQGKLESGGVWFARGGYQIAKNTALNDAQLLRLPLNVEVVEEFAGMYPGKVSVMIVPSPANILQDKLRYSPPQVDENAYMDDMFARFGAAGARVIDLRPAFTAAEAAGQQVYFRTDHHWTTEGGAFMAYEAFCEAMGIQPVQPPQDIWTPVSGFLGTNFSKTVRLGTQPETLGYFDFTNPITIHKGDGSLLAEKVPIMAYEKLDTFDKYAAFLHGNNGYSVIEGNGEGSVLVIKDSYGNCFSPYLLQNYAKVGIIDLRDWYGVSQVMEEEEYDEILVLYSFSSFSQDGGVRYMVK